MSISGLWDAIGLCAEEELVGTCEDCFTAVDFDFDTLLSSSFLFLRSLRHLFGAAYHARILTAANRAEMATVEQMKKFIRSSRVKVRLVNMSES